MAVSAHIVRLTLFSGSVAGRRRSLAADIALELVEAKVFDAGAVVLRYRVP